MSWMLLPYRRYFDFAGRSRRMEYWMFALFTALVGILSTVLLLLIVSIATPESNIIQEDAAGGPLVAGLIGVIVVWSLATLIPSLAVSVRRMHDTDHSGWWLLIGFIPVVGGLVLLYFYLIEGTRGPNRYGPDPKEGVPRGV